MGEVLPGPLHGSPGCDIKVYGFVQTRDDPIMISTNSDSFEFVQDVNNFSGIWAIAHEISAAGRAIVSDFPRPSDGGFQSFKIRVDVAEEEVPHSV